MLLHGVNYSINFQLFSLGEIAGNYFTPVTLIIAMPIISDKFHDFISGQHLKLPVSC